MRFESKRGSKIREKKSMFCKLEILFIFGYFFIIFLHLHFKDDFYSLK
jgi:hypothetical protein